MLRNEHAHFDHAANANANKIKIKYGASVIVHRDEADYLANGDNIIPQGTTPLTRPCRKCRSDDSKLVKITANRVQVVFTLSWQC
jgi:glyoxylase-like metal-dependent hydrolase (beta-lactamase superfamily II)